MGGGAGGTTGTHVPFTYCNFKYCNFAFLCDSNHSSVHILRCCFFMGFKVPFTHWVLLFYSIQIIVCVNLTWKVNVICWVSAERTSRRNGRRKKENRHILLIMLLTNEGSLHTAPWEKECCRELQSSKECDVLFPNDEGSLHRSGKRSVTVVEGVCAWAFCR